MRQVPQVSSALSKSLTNTLAIFLRYISKLLFALYLILHFLIDSCCAAADKHSHPTAQVHYEQGIYWIHLYPKGNTAADYQRIGIDYGRALRNPLSNFYISIQLAVKQHHAQAHAQYLSEQLYNHYPSHWRAFMRGIAAGAQLSLAQIKLINSFEHLPIFAPQAKPSQRSSQPGSNTPHSSRPKFGCAELFFRPPRQAPLALRWYDYFAGHKTWRNKLSVTVFHWPKAQAVALITYLGTLNGTTLINQSGLFLTVNNATYSARRLSKPDQKLNYSFIFSTTALLDYMRKARNVQQFTQLMQHHRASLALIYNLLDLNNGQTRSYEVTPAHHHTIEILSQAWASTNHFQDYGWKYQQPTAPEAQSSYTYLRLKHLQHLGSTSIASGSPVTTEQAQNIFNKPLQHTGATRPSNVMQLIVDRNTLYLRVPHFFHSMNNKTRRWSQIKLKELFNSQQKKKYK